MILKYKGKYNPLTVSTGPPYLQLLCSKELELGFFLNKYRKIQMENKIISQIK